MDEISHVGLHSGYSKEDDMPFVCFHFKNVTPFQVDAVTAFSISNMISDAALNAVASSFLFKFMTEKLHVPTEMADTVTGDFAKYFEQNLPSAEYSMDRDTFDTTERLDRYSDYLFNLVKGAGIEPLDINEWAHLQEGL